MEKPNWLNRANVKRTLDARPILAMGQHPLEQVIQESSTLNAGEIYEIITPFPPFPMIEKLSALGFETYSEQDEIGVFHSYFLKQ